MRFCVDAHAIGRHLTGNEAYVRNLLGGFASLGDSSEFVAYLSVEGAERFVPSGFRARMVAANPFVRLGFDLSRKVREDKADLLHVQYTAPLACPAPVIVSVHDVSYLEHPEYFTKARALQLRWSVKRTIQRAARVVTISEFSRKSIAKAYGLDGENIVAVPLAVSECYKPLNRAHALAFVRERFNMPFPFILTVGDLQPRKNPLGLIKAYEELIAHHPNLPQHLVFVGSDTWFAPRVKAAAEKSPVRDRIHFTGYVDENELPRFYNACEIFVFPSFYEGFGIPILEAMACGRAVACGNTSAMPEVADASAVLFDPYSTEAIYKAMRDLLIEPELRARMERLGQQNAALFSWKRTARETLDVYYEVARASRDGRLVKKSVAV